MDNTSRFESGNAIAIPSTNLMDQIFGGDEQRTATLRQYDAALAMIDIHLAHAKAALEAETKATETFIDWETV